MIFEPTHFRDAKAHYEKEGIVCIRFKPDVTISKRFTTLPLYSDPRVASRKTICLGNTDRLVTHVFEKFRRIFHQIHGYSLLPGSFPLEYREYQPRSKGMDWHRDLQMYQPAQVEMVYTVFNDDRSTRFQWKDRRGTVHTMKPRAGDLVMVKPKGPFHRVTPMGEGKRGIIKFVGYPLHAVALGTKYREASLCPRGPPTLFSMGPLLLTIFVVVCCIYHVVY